VAVAVADALLKGYLEHLICPTMRLSRLVRAVLLVLVVRQEQQAVTVESEAIQPSDLF
jgi:hypothetical protein